MKRRHSKLLLFKPYIPLAARERAYKTMGSQWTGQGPQVDKFEELFEQKISGTHKAVAVNSGTSALHLSYILSGIKPGDKVIVPVFTCSATMTPLLYLGAKIVFADIDKETMCIDPSSVEKLMDKKVKAIVPVHYGGLPCDMNSLYAIAKDYNIPVIEDAAQAVGATYLDKHIGEMSEFTCFSFQAIKHITTGDGGMLTIKNPDLVEKAKRIRWFGIDRKAKFEDRWKKDIAEVGYKYQMTDIAASLGIEALKLLPTTLRAYNSLYYAYWRNLRDMPDVRLVGDKFIGDTTCFPSYWLATIISKKRDKIQQKLEDMNVESNQVHYRCDRYSVFGGRSKNCPVMDTLEDQYLVLPLHRGMTLKDVDFVCEVVREAVK